MSWRIEHWTKQFAGVIGQKNSTIYNNPVFAGVIGQKNSTIYNNPVFAGVIGQKKFHHI